MRVATVSLRDSARLFLTPAPRPARLRSYLLGSYATYHTAKHFTSPIMRFGLFLIVFRLVDFFFISGAYQLPSSDKWCIDQVSSCPGRREGSPDDIHDLSIDRKATCHFPCRWVCHSATGTDEPCHCEHASCSVLRLLASF